MEKYMIAWIDKNFDKILNTYADAKPLLCFFYSFFADNARGYDYLSMLKLAATGKGIAITTSAYLLMDDVIDEGDEEIKNAEFYFCDEFDGAVSFETYLAVLDIITHAYVEFYPENKVEILQTLNKAHLFF